MSISPVSSVQAMARRVYEEHSINVRVGVATVATFALIDLLFPGKADLTGALTTLLVMQGSFYKTIQSVFDRVLAVVVGVLYAVLIGAFFGLTVWSLALVVLPSLYFSSFLGLKDNKLEVSISGMLILAAAQQEIASEQRVLNTLIGAALGLAVILLWPMKPKLSAALQTVNTLAERTASTGKEIATTIQESAEELTVVQEASPLLDELLPEVQQAREEVEEVRRNYFLNYSSALDKRIGRHRVDLMSAIRRLEHTIGLLRQIVVALEVESELVEAELATPEYQSDLRLLYSEVVHQASESVRCFGLMLDAGLSDEAARFERNLAKALEKLGGSRAMLIELASIPEMPEVTVAFITSVLKHVEALERELSPEELEEFQVNLFGRNKLARESFLDERTVKKASLQHQRARLASRGALATRKLVPVRKPFSAARRKIKRAKV